MINKYEQQKQLRSAVHKDMEIRVDQEARASFIRKPYDVQSANIKSMLELKRDINFLLSRAGKLDSWEQETIRRIARRIQEGSGTDGEDYARKTQKK